MEDAEEIGDEERGEDHRRDEPGCYSLNEPVDLPGPAFDATEGDEVGSGSEAADPVIDDANKRIWSHASLDLVNDSCVSVARTIVPDSYCVGEIYSLLNFELLSCCAWR